MHAYWTLASERVSNGQTLGQIPWSATIRFAAYSGLRGTMIDALWVIVHSMDAGYLSWMKNEHDRYVRANKRRKSAASQVPQKAGQLFSR